MGARWW